MQRGGGGDPADPRYTTKSDLKSLKLSRISNQNFFIVPSSNRNINKNEYFNSKYGTSKSNPAPGGGSGDMVRINYGSGQVDQDRRGKYGYRYEDEDVDDQVRDERLEPEPEPEYKIYQYKPKAIPRRRWRRPIHNHRRKYYYNEDDDGQEIYKITPKFQYLHQGDRYLLRLRTTPSTITFLQDPNAAKHQQLAAGVSFVALMLLMLFVCCLLPLFYYLCRPQFRKRSKSFNLKEWFKEHLTPRGEAEKSSSDSDDVVGGHGVDEIDFGKEYHGHSHHDAANETTLYERPPRLPVPPHRPRQSLPKIHYPKEEQQQQVNTRQYNYGRKTGHQHQHQHHHHHKNSKNPAATATDDNNTRVSLHIQLKETPLDLSISEIDEEYAYTSDMSDIGRRKQQRKRTV